VGEVRESHALEGTGTPGQRPRSEGTALTCRRLAAIGASCRLLGCACDEVAAGAVVVKRSPRLACQQDLNTAPPPPVARPSSSALVLWRSVGGPRPGHSVLTKNSVRFLDNSGNKK
jgi:hypothetical protein